MNDYPRDKVAFVKIGYNDACTEFTVRFHRQEFDDLDKVMRNVDSYNAYAHVKVRKAFASIRDLIQTAKFGREGSPVLYLTLKGGYWKGPTENEFVNFTVEERKALITQIRLAFKKALYSEFDVVPDGSIRIWWD